MKVDKVDILINPMQNTNRKYLYNDVYDIVKQNRLGAEFNPNYIKLYQVPRELIKKLNEFNISFKRKVDDDEYRGIL